MLAIIRASINWPERSDQVVRLYRDWAAAANRDVEGFHGLMALEDRTTGQGIAITFYGDQAASAAGQDVAEAALSPSARLFVVPPIREEYEVLVNGLALARINLDEDTVRVRVTMVRTRPEQLDDMSAVVRDHVLANSRQQGGNCGYLALGNRQTGKAMHMTFWESESALHASESSGNYQRQIARIAPFLVERPTREVYEIVAYGLTEALLAESSY